jgi:hypothetical protein
MCIGVLCSLELSCPSPTVTVYSLVRTICFCVLHKTQIHSSLWVRHYMSTSPIFTVLIPNHSRGSAVSPNRKMRKLSTETLHNLFKFTQSVMGGAVNQSLYFLTSVLPYPTLARNSFSTQTQINILLYLWKTLKMNSQTRKIVLYFTMFLRRI